MPTGKKNKPKILISSLIMAEEPERFRDELREFDVDFYTTGQFLTEQEISNYLASNGPIDGWISGDDEVTDSILEQASPNLKIISKWGSGLDSIDLESAERRAIAVFNSPGDIAISVAEVALGYGISLLRSLHFVDRQIRIGEWPKTQGWNIRGLRAGIVGYGRIGQELGNILTALGAKVLIHDPNVPHLNAKLERILEESKVVFICSSLNDQTEKLFSLEEFFAMQIGSFIVNVSRGPIVDEKSLLQVIESGHLGGAALDVFEKEPLPLDSPLRRFPNVILGSHNANNTFSARESVHIEAISNLRSRTAEGTAKKIL